MKQEYKFERLEIWKISLDFLDIVYEISKVLPEEKKFTPASQIKRPSTSISLNIAEGSTSVSDPEQKRYLNIALHSYIELYACYKIMPRRKYIIEEVEICEKFEQTSAKLFAKIQAFIKVLKK